MRGRRAKCQADVQSRPYGAGPPRGANGSPTSSRALPPEERLGGRTGARRGAVDDGACEAAVSGGNEGGTTGPPGRTSSGRGGVRGAEVGGLDGPVVGTRAAGFATTVGRPKAANSIHA